MAFVSVREIVNGDFDICLLVLNGIDMETTINIGPGQPIVLSVLLC